MEFHYGLVTEALATELFNCASCDLTSEQWGVIDSTISAIAADYHAAAAVAQNTLTRQRTQAILDRWN